MSFHKEHIITLSNSENEYKLIMNIENNEESIHFILTDLQNPMNESYDLKISLEKLKLLDSFFKMFDSIIECANNISNIIKDFAPKLTKEDKGMSLNLIIYIGGLNKREIKLFLETKPFNPVIVINELKDEIKKLNNKINDFEITINQKDKMYNELKNDYNELKTDFDEFKEQYRVDIINLKSLIPQNYNINENPNLRSFKEQQKIYSNEQSTIIDNNVDLNLLSNKIRLIYPGKNVIYNLLYRKSRDGDKALAFHQKCDNIRGTLIIIKTKEGVKFGGYTNESWEGNGVSKTDNTSFIYSLKSNRTYDIKKNNYAIYCNPNYGPCFGNINVTFGINDNCDIIPGVCCKAQDSSFSGYESDYEINNNEQYFKIQDYEVFKVTLV